MQHGSQYRLGEPARTTSAVQYVTGDRREAVVLVYREAQQYDSPSLPIRLRGLDPDAVYRLDDGSTLSGAALMGHGLVLELTGDYASRIVQLKIE